MFQVPVTRDVETATDNLTNDTETQVAFIQTDVETKDIETQFLVTQTDRDTITTQVETKDTETQVAQTDATINIGTQTQSCIEQPDDR
jgi:hypothetical protein